MFTIKTVRRGERVAVWDATGEVRLVDGPKQLWLFGERMERLKRFRAEADEYLVVQFIDGTTEHQRGPIDLWYDPLEHDSVSIRPAETIDAHDAIIIYTRQPDKTVTRRVLYGPAQCVPEANQWIRRMDSLRRYSAAAHEYLAVSFLDGRREHVRGPVDLWFRPDEHEAITVEEAIPVDAHQALLVYQRNPDESVGRSILHGPAQYVPQENQWLHEFSWHGADPERPRYKIPRALQFTKLRVIPDQMYFDVQDVRTADDALLVVQLMVFFELQDIDRMLDQTHDPIADFINALSADVIDFAASRSFEEFKEATNSLNELSEYKNLVHRAERIGYRINKVVYRGYVASDKLQTMHDDAIEQRTSLQLQAETERQAQELADLKLAREADREDRRRQMQQAQVQHEQRMEDLKRDGDRKRREADQQQEIAHLREQQAVEIDQLKAENDERLRFLSDIQGLQVDLTRYLVAQYQHPDRLIRVEGSDRGQLHLHDN